MCVCVYIIYIYIYIYFIYIHSRYVIKSKACTAIKDILILMKMYCFITKIIMKFNNSGWMHKRNSKNEEEQTMPKMP